MIFGLPDYRQADCERRLVDKGNEINACAGQKNLRGSLTSQSLKLADCSRQIKKLDLL